MLEEEETELFVEVVLGVVLAALRGFEGFVGEEGFVPGGVL